MKTLTKPSTVIHPGFMEYVAINEKELKSFLKAIAVNAIGQVITLAALGIKAKAIMMPNMSIEPRCRLELPKAAWVNNLDWLPNEKIRQVRYLEVICWQISGAVAEIFFDESDHYSNLRLGDIEGSYKLLSAYASSHNVPSDQLLAGCTIAVERLLEKHYDLAATMGSFLFKQGDLSTQQIRQFLSDVREEELGNQVLAVIQEPWIEDEADRVHRMFIGVG